MAVPHDPVAAAEAMDPRARMEVNMAKVLSFMLGGVDTEEQRKSLAVGLRIAEGCFYNFGASLGGKLSM